MSRYQIEKIMLMTPSGREFEFEPDSLRYLPTVEEAGAEFHSPLWDVLAIVEAANEPGVVIHLDENHTKAIKPYIQKKIRGSPITDRSDEKLLELLGDV